MRAFLERLKIGEGRMFYCAERVAPSYPFAWHYHPEFELTYIVHSRGRRFIGDHIGTYLDGDLLLIGPNLPHTWASEGEGSHQAVVIQFGEDVLGKAGVQGLSAGPMRKMLEQSALGLRFFGGAEANVGAALQEMAGLSPVRQLATLLTVLDDLSGAMESEVLSSRLFVDEGLGADAHPVDRVCSYIHEHYRERIPLERAAQEAAMSVSAFCRFFKRTTGKTFSRYVNELRLGNACRLLVETEQNIAQIAQDSGFTNLSHFNQAFLASKKLRPGEYRRVFRKGAEK
jgi:AraC-like DNA-binding protein